jgi:hypothetical protein
MMRYDLRQVREWSTSLTHEIPFLIAYTKRENSLRLLVLTSSANKIETSNA